MLRHLIRSFKFEHSRISSNFRQFHSKTFSRSRLSNFSVCNLKFGKVDFHLCTANGRLFVSNENMFAYDIINKDFERYRPVNTNQEVTSIETFNAILNQNWKDRSSSQIVKAFTNTKNFCISNNITLSDGRFDSLVDGLMDNCEKLSDQELISLLYCISEFPPCESYDSHNFHDIWSCLDDICCWKMTEWDVDTCFIVANAWYELNLGRICDFIFTLIDRLTRKSDKLSKEELVNILFYLNICRKRAVDFEYEFALEKLVKHMSVDEMAVVAMGYFKTKTKIKLLPILEVMIQEVILNSKTIHEITLTAILKIIRFSKPVKLLDEIHKMLDVLQYEIDRLSELCCLHIALIGTGIQTYHETSLRRVSEKIVPKIADKEKIRLKDIERILNSLSMFDLDPETEPDIFEACLIELNKQTRLEEQVKYPKCLPCALNYLSLRNIYSHELMDRIFDIEFIEQTYGKTAKNVSRELFSLDCSIDIECVGYNGNRLPLHLRYKAAKWLTEFTPSHDQWKKLTAGDKLVLDVIDVVKTIVKDENLIFIHHVLPHFSRADIILCKDQTGQLVKPVGFENYVLGDVMFPFNKDNLKWFAIVVLGLNNTTRYPNQILPLGNMIMKKRQLEKIGYTPVFIYWNEFSRLSGEMRCEYINSKLS